MLSLVFSDSWDLSLSCHSPLSSGLVMQQNLQALAECQRQHREPQRDRSGEALRANFKLSLPRVERVAIFSLFLMPGLRIILEASACTSCMHSYRFTTLSAQVPCPSASQSLPPNPSGCYSNTASRPQLFPWTAKLFPWTVLLTLPHPPRSGPSG